jgi:hypothetical protein
MTRYMLHYYQKDDGWIEFKTKEQMEEAKQQFEDGESDVSDISNEAHWLYKAVKDYKRTDCSEEFITNEEEFEADEEEPDYNPELDAASYT